IDARLVRGSQQTRGGPVREIDPADVRAIRQAAEIAEAILVHAEIIRRTVLVINPVGWRTVAETDPANVRGVDVPGADIFADHRAVVRVTAAVQPADVGAVGV